MGEDRKISFVREISKKHEEVLRMNLGEAKKVYDKMSEEDKIRGEFVLVVEGKSLKEIKDEKIKAWETIDIGEHFKMYEAKGFEKKEAMKMVAKDRGISKREVYAELSK